ncbi:LacI family DNA-binding transcriptional regulator [Robbsia sp. KACC 23696]|uniref:LacI family DNA-binding transcriptional regulator n=1 Tax=Robbsia sp. KACC 23696 TaxID=3149231 RepID=UPI00325A9E52
MPDRAAPATLKSIAAELGVHVSTVSRVLNGEPEQASRAASAEVVTRIRALAQRRGYRPNVQATSLQAGRSKEFAVLMTRLSDLVMAMIYEGIDEAADAAGYAAFVSNTLDNPALQRARAERALLRQVAGLIVGDSHIDAPEPLAAWLTQRQVPFVLVSRRLAGYPSVTCDDNAGGRLAARHLFEMGHREVAILAGETHAATSVDRRDSFLDFFRRREIAVPEARVLSGKFDTETGRELGERLLAKRPYPTAIFAVNDFLAIGLMGAMRDRGLHAGRDIAVIGYNDTPLAAQLPVALTSVRLPMQQMGRLAVGMLLDILAGRAVAPVLLTPTLEVRASSLGH